MIIRFENTDIYYWVKGTGNPLVFLHGFLESSVIWEPFLKKLAGKRQVICIDLPGHGRSGIIGEVHSMELMADAVKMVMDKLEITIATFIGHSMGGYVSLAFCENYPQNVAGLVLMNSTPLEDNEEKKLNRDRSVMVVEKNKKLYVNAAISGLVAPENAEIFKSQIEAVKIQANKIPTKGITAALKGMKIRTNKIETLQNFGRLKIMISGIKDPILSHEETENIANITKCRHFSVNGGHLSYLENFTEIDKIMHFID